MSTTINTTNHLMTQFAHRFIHALNNLNTTKTTTTPPAYNNDHDHIMSRSRRSRRVKIAAYTAMASVVGSRRAWSRALLWKIRNRSRNRPGFLLLRNRKRITNSRVKRLRNPNPKSKNTNHDHHIYYSGEEEWVKLRKLVPGAENMDSWCSFMDETADYIKCLAAQVHVMKTILDRYTPPPPPPNPIP